MSEVRQVDEPSDAATIERAHRLANEAMHMVALQHRRVRTEEPEDRAFAFRWWADLQFLVISLRRLRLAAVLATKHQASRAAVKRAVETFDEVLPSLRRMRNIGEHIDEYAIEKGHDRQVDRRQLEVGAFDGTTFEWLGGRLNIDEGLAAGESLCRAVRDAHSAQVKSS